MNTGGDYARRPPADLHALAIEISGYLQSLPGTIKMQIPNPRSLLQLPLFSSSLTQSPLHDLSRSSQSCPNAELSCHNTSIIPDTCCFNSPGGQFLQTQFWDTAPPTGPVDSWTIHGLWPDHCDGSFDQYCDKAREHSNITRVLESFDQLDLLAFMKTYWKDFQGADSSLWSHEWNKHGTCVSTLETSCYSDYVPQEEVVDYFEKAVALFKDLPTYKTLEAAGIVPDESRTYTRTEIQNALEEMHGAPVTLGCHRGALDEIWYHFEVRGSLQTGQWVAALPDGGKSTCPTHGIRYLPKNPRSTPTTTGKKKTTATQTTSPTSTSTNPPFTGAGYLQVLIDGSSNGCLISDGSWFTSGTCGTYHAQDDSSEMTDSASDHTFTLTSSKGPCGFVDGSFKCGRSVGKQDIFHIGDGGLLALKTSTTFFAESVPRHAQRTKLSAEKGDKEIEVQIEWEAR